MPEREHYITKFTNKILKWKASFDLTLDLSVKVESQNPPKIGLYTISYNKDGSRNNKGKLVLFKHSTDPALLSKDGTVVECYFSDGMWKFFRDRPDKLKPNVDWVVKQLDEDIRNPVTKEDLLKMIHSKTTSPRHHYEPHNNKPTTNNRYKREPPYPTTNTSRPRHNKK